MRITTKAHYAVTALLDLALLDDQEPISLPDIAARQGISLSYLEQLFSRLRKCGLVVSSRGRAGGYRLGLAPNEISVARVIDAMDESIDTTRCHGRTDCQQGEICLTHHLWTDLSDHIYEFLDSISLADLVARKDFIGPDSDHDQRMAALEDSLQHIEGSLQGAEGSLQGAEGSLQGAEGSLQGAEGSSPVEEDSRTKRLVTG